MDRKQIHRAWDQIKGFVDQKLSTQDRGWQRDRATLDELVTKYLDGDLVEEGAGAGAPVSIQGLDPADFLAGAKPGAIKQIGGWHEEPLTPAQPDSFPQAVVHIMRQGTSLCGMRGPASSWPKGHEWVMMQDGAKASCSKCVSEFANHDWPELQ